MKRVLFFITLSLLLACQNESNSGNAGGSGGQTQNNGIGLPSLPAEKYSDMFRQVTNIDLIAYTTNLSMSFDEAKSVRSILQYISKEATTLPAACEKTARITFISDGGIYMEADVYAYDGCSAFVFFENGAQTYANMIDPLGVEFFQRFIPKEGPEQETPVQ